MSRENVELVRRVLDAFERRDSETLFASYHPDVEWDVSRMSIAETLFEPVYRGHAGIRAFWREYLSALGSVEFTYGELVDAGDAIVVPTSQRIVGRASGAALEMRDYATVWTVRDGVVRRMEMYPTLDEALAAVR